jgi:hypothetical protein
VMKRIASDKDKGRFTKKKEAQYEPRR